MTDESDDEPCDPPTAIVVPAGVIGECRENEYGETIVGCDPPTAASQACQKSYADSVQKAPVAGLPADVPKFIGRYEIRGVLGKGAFGAVYRGHDAQLARDVAIKVPLTSARAGSTGSIGSTEDFLLEARRLARLSHTGIVRVLDVAAEQGTCYIVSEFLDGPNLNEWVRTNSPTLEQSLTIVVKIADALAHAHSQRTVHRDLKPANVILTQEADGVCPVLVDFGLALSETSGNSAGQIGAVAGTPNYMAPEQALGMGHRIDGRTDIYALGVILYRLLCGRLPFAGGTINTLLHRITTEEPVPPRQVRRDIPVSVEKICLKAMAREITDRYSTAGDLSADLRTELDRLKKMAAPAEDPIQRKPAVRQDAVRRQVTVLNCGCDLFESEEFLEETDPEEQHALLQKYDSICREVVATLDGRVVQSTGTELLVCFGYPTAYEDAAERAVRTGLSLLKRFRELQDALDRSIEFSVWVGVHTGQAVMQISEDGTLSMMGDARNVATHMESISEENAVVVTEATHRLISGRFDCDSHGKLKIKGASRKVGVFLVTGESKARHRLDVAENVALTPIVGRERELALLVDAWEQARDGDGQLICIIGEAGLGKSRLVREVRQHAQQECTSGSVSVVEWRCSPFFRNTGLYPAIDFLTRTLSFGTESSPAGRLEKLVAYLEMLQIADAETVSLLADMLSVPANDRYPSLGLSPIRQKAETLNALSRWLKACADRTPVLFIVEDLHWIDATSLEWIGRLADSSEGLAALSVLTFRPEFETPWGSRGNQTQIALNRLTQREIGEMLRERLGIAEVPTEVIQKIVQRTEGVPLFIEEFCNTLMESGALQESEGELRLAADFDMSAIPSTLQDLLISRIDRLDSQHDIVFIGATIGREFSDQLIRAVTKLDDDTLHEELEKLVQAEIVFREGTSPRAIYTFKHALIQDAAYNSLLKKRRQNYHLNIADVLEAEFPEVVASQPELLAHHFTEADRALEAISYWGKAGRNAQGSYANREAIGHFSRGLKLIEMLDQSPERNQLELAFQAPLATVQIATQGYAHPEPAERLERASELARQLGDMGTMFFVRWGLWARSLLLNQMDDCVRMGDELLALAADIGQPALQTEAHYAPCASYAHRGEFIRAVEHYNKAIVHENRDLYREYAKHTGQNAGVTLRIYAGLSKWALGFPDEGMALGQEAVEIARAANDAFSLVHGTNHASWVAGFRGDVPMMESLVNETVTVSEEQAFAFWLATGNVAKGYLFNLQGRPADALTTCVRGIKSFRETGGELHLSYAQAILSAAHLQLGNAAEGLKEAISGLQLVLRFKERYVESELLRLCGESQLLLSGPNDAVAEEYFHRALAVAKQQHAMSWQLRILTSLCRMKNRDSANQESVDALAAVYDWFKEGLDTDDLKSARRLLATLS